MKKFLFFGITVLSFIFESCSNDLIDYPNSEAVQASFDLKEEKTIDGTERMLQFDNMEDFHEALRHLEGLSKEEILLWNQSKDFSSMYELYTKINDSMDNVKDAEEYYALRNQCLSVFIFNDEDPFDLSMYLPVNDWQYSKIINKDGNVMISDKVHCFKDFETYSDFKKAKGVIFSGVMPVTDVVYNYCELTDNYEKRKFKVQATWENSNERVAFTLWASSKFLFGWKDLATEYYCWDSPTEATPIWRTMEVPSGTTYWSKYNARKGDYYICTRSFTSDRRVLIKLNL